MYFLGKLGMNESGIHEVSVRTGAKGTVTHVSEADDGVIEQRGGKR